MDPIKLTCDQYKQARSPHWGSQIYPKPALELPGTNLERAPEPPGTIPKPHLPGNSPEHARHSMGQYSLQQVSMAMENCRVKLANHLYMGHVPYSCANLADGNP